MASDQAKVGTAHSLSKKIVVRKSEQGKGDTQGPLRLRSPVNYVCVVVAAACVIWLLEAGRSGVRNKENQRWLWHVIDHATGEILAYVLGD